MLKFTIESEDLNEIKAYLRGPEYLGLIIDLKQMIYAKLKEELSEKEYIFLQMVYSDLEYMTQDTI